MPQSSQTSSRVPAESALRQALEGAGYSPVEASELIEPFRAEVLTVASWTLGHLGYAKASALLVDAAEMIGVPFGQGGAA